MAWLAQSSTDQRQRADVQALQEPKDSRSMSRSQRRDEQLKESTDESWSSNLGGNQDEAGEDENEPVEDGVEGSADLVWDSRTLNKL